MTVLAALLCLAGLLLLALAGRRAVVLRGERVGDLLVREDWLGLLRLRLRDVRAVRVAARGAPCEAPEDRAWRVELDTADGGVPLSSRWTPEEAPRVEEASRVRRVVEGRLLYVVARPVSNLGLALGATLLVLGLTVAYRGT